MWYMVIWRKYPSPGLNALTKLGIATERKDRKIHMFYLRIIAVGAYTFELKRTVEDVFVN